MSNDAKQMTNILFRSDGSPDIGFGHIVRCLALADELHDFHNCRITFAMRTGPLGIQMVEAKGYQVITSRKTGQSFDYREWLNECVNNMETRALVLDVRDGLPRTVVDELRNNGILIVTIDDPEDKRLSADLAFYPPVPQVKRVDWTGFTGELYAGWEWVILRKEFSTTPCPKPQAPSSKLHAPKVLVTLGGSDPQGMTIKAVKALEMLEGDFEVVVVLGAGFQHKEELNDLLFDCKHHFNVRENVQNVAELMSQSDLAVASFGVTAYELAAMGVPSIYLCLTEDHAESASAFVEAGIALNMKVYHEVSEAALAGVVEQLLKHPVNRLKMTENANRLSVGQGAQHIAREIEERIEYIHE